MRLHILQTLLCSLGILYITTAASLDSTRIVRSPTGVSQQQVVRDLQRELSRASLTKREEWKNSATLDSSFDGAVLFQVKTSANLPGGGNASVALSAGIEIVCKTCYIKGVVTGELSVPEDFNITETIDEIETNFTGIADNFTDATIEFLKDTWEEIEDAITSGGDDPVNFPPFPFDFDIDIPAIPETNLRFSLDGFELYMLVDTILSLGATYTLPLYKSNTPVGISVGDLELGLIFDVDLILSAQGKIDISSGIHLKLDDGFAIDIALFGDDASSITFNGGQFEFLPVTVESAGVVLGATLRLGCHAGLSLSTMSTPTLFNETLPTIGAGIEVGVFANVAELTTNITYQSDNDNCTLEAAQSIKMALGAAAGATVHVGSERWGKIPSTSVAFFTTELASACVIEAAVRTTTTPAPQLNTAPQKRQDVLTTTLSTIVTSAAVICETPGLINCPASAQNTTQFTVTKTLVTTYAAGVDTDDLTFPAATQQAVNTAVATVPFGDNALPLPSSSGSPVAYTAPATATATASGGGSNGRGVPKATIIGVSVGLGVPALLLIVGVLVCMLRRRKGRGGRPTKEKRQASPGS